MKAVTRATRLTRSTAWIRPMNCSVWMIGLVPTLTTPTAGGAPPGAWAAAEPDARHQQGDPDGHTRHRHPGQIIAPPTDMAAGAPVVTILPGPGPYRLLPRFLACDLRKEKPAACGFRWVRSAAKRRGFPPPGSQDKAAAFNGVARGSASEALPERCSPVSMILTRPAPPDDCRNPHALFKDIS